MSRFLSLDELLNKKKTQESKPVYVAPMVEDTPKVEDASVIEDAPVKPAKKGGKKTAVEA